MIHFHLFNVLRIFMLLCSFFLHESFISLLKIHFLFLVTLLSILKLFWKSILDFGYRWLKFMLRILHFILELLLLFCPFLHVLPLNENNISKSLVNYQVFVFFVLEFLLFIRSRFKNIIFIDVISYWINHYCSINSSCEYELWIWRDNHLSDLSMMSIEFIEMSIYERIVIDFDVSFFSSDNKVLSPTDCFNISMMRTLSFFGEIILFNFFFLINDFHVSLSSIRAHHNNSHFIIFIFWKTARGETLLLINITWFRDFT